MQLYEWKAYHLLCFGNSLWKCLNLQAFLRGERISVSNPMMVSHIFTIFFCIFFVNDIDYVLCTITKSLCRGKLVIFEDNDAVIKACIKGRSPAMTHVGGTQRVDLVWLWEWIREDLGVFIKYVGTKDQLADIFTKGSFTAEHWVRLCRLAQIGYAESLRSCK